ncbi:MAG: response regulator [Butyrivibrio sp.]|uniref:response regulator transcription factor n=1 Tax=Butyrivibrio sp. TaxID=28121 RepID=UPI0025E147CF|nr:response regulator [Butyrivibrio sp.]MCR5770811.1 response regulator [Butyrivibrio sp.]
MLSVLIVDDEKLVRTGIVMGIDWASLGCAVVAEASDGQEGYDAATKYNPDLIICDIRMPKMDGIEMVSKLRKDGNNAYTVFLTAYSDFAYAQKAIKLGASDYILKPFKDGELEATVIKIRDQIDKDYTSKTELRKSSILNDDNVKKDSVSKYVSDALYYIEKNYGNTNISVKLISDSLGLSESHLSHMFKKETDYTINAYITRYRIRAAIDMLRSGKYKVYEVAEKVGYKDITYFSSTFKKITGTSPSDYAN